MVISRSVPPTKSESPDDPPRSAARSRVPLSPRVPMEMEPVFDQSGRVVAWLRGDHVLDPLGRHVAFLRNNWVLSYRGSYLGRLYAGWFRDLKGAAVGFTEAAREGVRALPQLPTTETPPSAPQPAPAPVPPRVPLPPTATVPMPVWNYGGWTQFLGLSRDEASEYPSTRLNA